MKQFVMLTGLPRSGTTWASDIIGRSPSVNYVTGEPFNPAYSKASFGIEVHQAYPYFHDDSEYLTALNSVFCLKFAPKDLIKKLNFIRSEKSRGRLYLKAMKQFYYSLNSKRNFFKDPALYFSAEKIYALYNNVNVLLMRHPAGFCSSMLRVKWSFYFETFWMQQQLMNDYLQCFYDELRFYLGKPYDYDILGRAILLWKIYAHVGLVFREKYTGNASWIFVNHEDLANEPVDQFQSLFSKLGIEFTDAIVEQLRRYSLFEKVEAEKGQVHSLNRNSARQAEIWKTRLAKKEIDQILKRTEGYIEYYY